MEAAVQFSSALLGVASPAPRCSLLVGSKKRSCSAARAPRQRGRRRRGGRVFRRRAGRGGAAVHRLRLRRREFLSLSLSLATAPLTER
jgi:hypothetical protein